MMTSERMELLILYSRVPGFVSRSLPWTRRHRRNVDLWKEVDISAILATIDRQESQRGQRQPLCRDTSGPQLSTINVSE